MPTSTSPKTSVWIERATLSTARPNQASGAGARRLRADTRPKGSASTAASSEPSVAMRTVVHVASARPAR